MMKIRIVLVLVIAAAAIEAASWNVSSWEFATIAAAVSFSSETRGIAPVSDNGSGSMVLETHDGGNTWLTDKAPETMMYMAAAATGNDAVASGLLTLQWSSSQQAGCYNFTNSLFGEGITAQNAGPISGITGGFAVVGATIIGNGNGAAITKDGGLSYKFSNASTLRTEARYGAFPSATTWYISAGEWPSDTKVDANDFQLSRRWILKNVRGRRGDGLMSARHVSAAGAPGNGTGWKAQIVKTTDGGATWTSVYYSEGLFYFNEIACFDENNCAAVAEADTSNAPGTYIFVTNNGGKNWTQTFHSPNPDDSLMAVTYVSATELWAAGGTMSQVSFVGNFYHSTDGGQTWTNNQVKGVYGNDLAVGSASRVYATAFNYMDLSSFMVYA